MDPREAIELLRDAVRGHGGTWADLGCGDGTFTRALVDLLPGSRIYAVDLDPAAISAVRRWSAKGAPHVVPVAADFTLPLDLPGLGRANLDGILLANALHYVRDAETVLARLAARLRTGGRIVFVEYDRRQSSRWVPYPVPAERLKLLAARAGLLALRTTATRSSLFGGRLYVAVAMRGHENEEISAEGRESAQDEIRSRSPDNGPADPAHDDTHESGDSDRQHEAERLRAPPRPPRSSKSMSIGVRIMSASQATASPIAMNSPTRCEAGNGEKTRIQKPATAVPAVSVAAEETRRTARGIEVGWFRLV
jgi:SAM-dependent methyltransferase